MAASTSAVSTAGGQSLIRPLLKNKRKVIARPSPEELKEREKGFLLDGTLLSRQANDETDRCNPSYLNIGIPQYNALKDPHLRRFLRSKSLPKTFQKEIKVVLTQCIPHHNFFIHRRTNPQPCRVHYLTRSPLEATPFTISRRETRWLPQVVTCNNHINL